MAEKQINGRIVHKHDTEENWLKATNFVPKQGELIIYDIDSTYNYERFKIGDGSTLVNSLPFADDAVKTLIDTKVESVKDLIGDTSVSDQITTALSSSQADWSATEGDAQILNKPSIPSKTSDLTNDSGFINTVDDALSSTSTNPVQNKVVNTAITNLQTLVGDTSVSSQISAALVAITNEEIDTICETTVESAEDVTL